MMETTLAGRYQVVKPLGSGGFGQTFLAHDTHLPGNPLCVVKKFKPKVSDPVTLATAKRLFAREAQTLYRLGNHDQIPRLLAHFEQAEEFYLVQEYIEGLPLDQELARCKRLNEATAIALLRDLLQVLAFVHQQNVIHRDIKPANLIRRSRDGKIVLIDFGAVKEVSSHVRNTDKPTSLTVAIGSPGYMPSEQQSFKPHFSSDIYAVGMVCLQALTGLSPRELPQDNRGEFCCAALGERMTISTSLAVIIDKMVRYDYRQRYETATVALEAIAPLIDRREQNNLQEFTTLLPTGFPALLMEEDEEIEGEGGTEKLYQRHLNLEERERHVIDADDVTVNKVILATQLNHQASLLVPLQFQSLIADKTDGFVGREFVFEAIEDFFHKQPNGYFTIEADPGVGKSAILAEYVRRTGCVVHFNVRSQGINRAEEFLKCVCTQLIERYNLPHPLPLNSENTRDGNFLARLLNEIVGTQSLALREKAVVIAVDALDEVDLSSQTAGANALYLPASLPNGVYFILTKRLTPLPLAVNNQRIFDLMQYEAESLQDVQTYIRRRASESALLQEWIASRGLAVEEFVRALSEKSDRNFMYLRYVLPAIEQGAYQDLCIENLPEGLEQYYYQHWENMGMTAKPLPRTKIKIVYVLAEARQPVSRQLISEFAGEDALTVQEVLEEWEQFLREQRVDGQTRYSIYHASFQDFLHHQDIVQAAGVTIQGINALIADNLSQELGL